MHFVHSYRRNLSSRFHVSTSLHFHENTYCHIITLTNYHICKYNWHIGTLAHRLIVSLTNLQICSFANYFFVSLRAHILDKSEH